MSPPAGECAELAADHRFSDEPVRTVATAVSVERLFRAVIDAGNAEGHDVQEESIQNRFRLIFVGTKASFIGSLADLVVVIEDYCGTKCENPGLQVLNCERDQNTQ